MTVLESTKPRRTPSSTQSSQGTTPAKTAPKAPPRPSSGVTSTPQGPQHVRTEPAPKGKTLVQGGTIQAAPQAAAPRPAVTFTGAAAPSSTPPDVTFGDATYLAGCARVKAGSLTKEKPGFNLLTEHYEVVEQHTRLQRAMANVSYPGGNRTLEASLVEAHAALGTLIQHSARLMELIEGYLHANKIATPNRYYNLVLTSEARSDALATHQARAQVAELTKMLAESRADVKDARDGLERLNRDLASETQHRDRLDELNRLKDRLTVTETALTETRQSELDLKQEVSRLTRMSATLASTSSPSLSASAVSTSSATLLSSPLRAPPGLLGLPAGLVEQITSAVVKQLVQDPTVVAATSPAVDPQVADLTAGVSQISCTTPLVPPPGMPPLRSYGAPTPAATGFNEPESPLLQVKEESASSDTE